MTDYTYVPGAELAEDEGLEGTTKTTPTLERDLIAQCQQSAKAMNAFLSWTGQKNARRAGNYVGYPDLTLICNGHVVLIEVKRPKSDGTPGGEVSLGQQVYMEKAAAQGVTVHAIWSVREFEELVNQCRRRRHDG